MTNMIPLPAFTYENPDDDEEYLIISMNGEIIASLSHDQHGWDGMESTRQAVEEIEAKLKKIAK